MRRAFGVRAAARAGCRPRRAGVRVDAQDRAVEADRIAGGAQVLAAQRAALGGRRRLARRPSPPGGSPHGLTGLPSWP